MGEDTTLLEATDLWHPVAALSELPERHVFQGRLLGQEFAVWRADDGHVNVWENRCLHRGVRLSIAQNDGRELKCQYHGWRYANRTAACTYIPAHPADAPPRTVRNRTFPVRIAAGLVWTSLGQPVDAPAPAEEALPARPLPVHAPPGDVAELLAQDPPAPPGAEDPSAARAVRRAGLAVEVDGLGVFHVQPVDSDRAIVRGLLDPVAGDDARLALLRHVDAALTRRRTEAERRAARRPAPAPLAPTYEPVPAELATLPPGPSRDLPTRVRVARAWDAARGVRGLELEPIGDTVLPGAQPGAHLDVALPGGHVRQYSLVGGPGETDRYVIGVKRTRDSTGGSIAAHEHVRVGDVLAVSLPRNGFPLRRDRDRTILVAGGIGITPILAMAQTLHHQRLRFDLHYFVAAPEEVAFTDRLAALPGVHVHVGLDPEGTARELERLCVGGDRDAGGDRQLYLCGPPPMLETAREIAGRAGWSAEHVGFEYFRNDREIDDSSRFDVVLARSVMTLTVEPGRTMLQTLRDAGVAVPSSCEQGACGTCRVAVLDGEPDHQDVYLDAAEKAAGDAVMTCVSRSLTPALTLDL